MSESIWKKEIGFKRKPKQTAPAPAPEPVQQAAPAAAAAPTERTEFPWLEPKQRWWNKEIGRSRRRPAAGTELSQLVQEVVHPVSPRFATAEELDPSMQRLYDSVVGQPVEEWGAPPAVPPAPVEVEVEVVAAPAADEFEPAPVEAVAEPGAQTSVWKKEIGFRRKAKQPQQPKQPKQPKQTKRVEQPPEQHGATKTKRPKRSRRRLSLPSLRRPSLGSHGSERLVGLKVGGSQIAAARINNNGVAELVQLARMPLQTGIVVGGELRDPQALADALRTFFAQHNLPRRGVRLGVSSSRIAMRIFEISGIDDERQFVNAVRFRAQEALPIPLEEAALDYRVLSESVTEDGERIRRVLLVVADKDLVERYVEACRLAGIQLAGIDLEAFALLRSLAPPAERNGAALVAVSIGHERTTLAVSDGRVCEFTRVLEWGGAAINVALARALDAAPGDVEQVKRTLSLLVGAPPPTGLSPEHAQAAVDAVRRCVESLARDLVSSLQYYQGQPGSLGIGEVVLTGGTAHLVGLAEELERLLGVSVRVGDPLRRLKVAGPVAENDLGSLAIAIGLGIED